MHSSVLNPKIKEKRALHILFVYSIARFQYRSEKEGHLFIMELVVGYNKMELFPIDFKVLWPMNDPRSIEQRFGLITAEILVL